MPLPQAAGSVLFLCPYPKMPVPESPPTAKPMSETSGSMWSVLVVQLSLVTRPQRYRYLLISGSRGPSADSPRSHPLRRDQYPEGTRFYGASASWIYFTPVFVGTGHPAAPRVYTQGERDLVLGTLNWPFKSSAWHIPLTIASSAVCGHIVTYSHFGPGNKEGYTVRVTLFSCEVGRIRIDSIQARIPRYPL